MELALEDEVVKVIEGELDRRVLGDCNDLAWAVLRALQEAGLVVVEAL